jgi:SWI/SNF-related matrix-associated actin-dependent regulator of chromatin subfamily A3
MEPERHQKEALDFMAQREIGPVPSEYSLWSASENQAQTWYVKQLKVPS